MFDITEKFIRRTMPEHPAVQGGDWTGLRVDGLVSEPTVISLRDLQSMPQVQMTRDFRCEEGWIAQSQRWEGVAVLEILRLVGPLREARYVRCSAGDFSINIEIEDALDPEALVALRLNGERLPAIHGGPCRLVAPARACYYSVKRLERMEITSTALPVTAKDIAMERLKARA